MAKFKAGQAVYHISGSHAYKVNIIKVLPPKTILGFPVEQQYIVKGSSPASILSSAFGDHDDVVGESSLTERDVPAAKKPKTKKG